MSRIGSHALSAQPVPTACFRPAGAFTQRPRKWTCHANRAAATGRATRLLCRASGFKVKEQGTGVEFDEVMNFWAGDQFRCLGASNRAKKIAFVGVKIYAVALYVEAEKAAKELGIRDRGGFFKDATDEDFNTAILDGAFDKLLQVQLVRNIEGSQFYEALEDKLAPRLRLTGGSEALQQFGEFVSKQPLEKGTNVLMMWRGSDTLDVVIRAGAADYSKRGADLTITSIPFSRGLFEVFLGTDSVVPEAKKQWAQGARNLLETDRVQKDTRGGAF